MNIEKRCYGGIFRSVSCNNSVRNGGDPETEENTRYERLIEADGNNGRESTRSDSDSDR